MFDHYWFNPPKGDIMSIELPELPYPKDALAPVISADTLSYHYGKHHQAYVNNLNNLIKTTDMENKSLEQIIVESGKDGGAKGIFNNAAQVWNHSFYWQCMKPGGGGKPTGKIAELINKDYGSYENFVNELKNVGVKQFGSGWAWLLVENNKLIISSTGNAETPVAENKKPILTVDVWEHAYYLDFQNRRPDYLSAFIEKLINWDFVNQNID
jgi:Fe-Mn family superoxide dismutase